MEQAQTEKCGQPSAPEPSDEQHGRAQQQEQVGEHGGHDHCHRQGAKQQGLRAGLAQFQTEEAGQGLKETHQSRVESAGRGRQAGGLRHLLGAVRAG